MATNNTKTEEKKVEAPAIELNNSPQTPVVDTNKAAAAKVDKKEETVEVNAGVLERVLAELADLRKNQETYEKTATQDQIARIDKQRAEGKLVKSVKVRRFRDKLLIGWKLVKDEVFPTQDGKLHEVQILELYTDDGQTFKEVSMIDFSRQSTYESYEVIRESKTADGHIEYLIHRADGKELTVKETFVN